MSKEINQKLAVFGGDPSIKQIFKPYNSLGVEEQEAANAVIKKGELSRFIGGWHADFNGGDKVKEFEKDCAEFFKVKHAITVNSWTSGLIAAIGAMGIEPGDEVIVTPWTMCASATAILHWNAIPVFADIDPESFNISPEAIESVITSRTKAIMAVDIFGLSCDMDAIMEIAHRHQLKVISDSAQAPGALYKGKHAGTIADIGGYSLNYHKHIHTGEGGIVVTNDDELANKVRLIRNHAEAVVEGMGVSDIRNMLGYNFRLGEIECAIGIEQLKKLPGILDKRQNQAIQLILKLKALKGIKFPEIRSDITHAFYILPIVVDFIALGITREQLLLVFNKEGLPLISGYQNLHLLPLFQQKIAYGSSNFPWTIGDFKNPVSYQKGICPVAERYHDECFIGIALCSYDLTDRDLDSISDTFYKVWESIEDIKHIDVNEMKGDC